MEENNWSIKFSHMIFNQFMFTSGDKTKWLIANKDQVYGWYTNEARQVIKSSKYVSGNTPKWYRRTTNLEDPWISIDDHISGSSDPTYLYGADSRSGLSFDSVKNNGGAKVFIRNAPSATPDGCLAPPV